MLVNIKHMVEWQGNQTLELTDIRCFRTKQLLGLFERIYSSGALPWELHALKSFFSVSIRSTMGNDQVMKTTAKSFQSGLPVHIHIFPSF